MDDDDGNIEEEEDGGRGPGTRARTWTGGDGTMTGKQQGDSGDEDENGRELG